jgi:hypothetical protein
MASLLDSLHTHHNLITNLRHKIHNKTTISCICKDHDIHTIQIHFIKIWSWEQYIHHISYFRLTSPYLTSHSVINPAYITMWSYLLSCLYKVQKHTTQASNLYRSQSILHGQHIIYTIKPQSSSMSQVRSPEHSLSLCLSP